MGIKGYEKLSLVDYDLKLSATIFFGGCNFRCPFCHNSSLVLDPNSVKDIPFCEIIEHLKKMMKRVSLNHLTVNGLSSKTTRIIPHLLIILTRISHQVE